MPECLGAKALGWWICEAAELPHDDWETQPPQSENAVKKE